MMLYRAPSAVLVLKKLCGGSLIIICPWMHTTVINHCDRSLRWLDRCLAAHSRPDEQSIFPIVQGGLDEQLREKSVKGIEINVD